MFEVNNTPERRHVYIVNFENLIARWETPADLLSLIDAMKRF